MKQSMKYLYSLATTFRTDVDDNIERIKLGHQGKTLAQTLEKPISEEDKAEGDNRACVC